MSAAAPRGKSAIIGLGIMGGAIAKNLSRRRLAGDRFRHRANALRRGEGRRRRDRRRARPRSPRRPTNILVSLPKPEALMATVEAIADGEAAAPRDRRALDLLARRQDRGREPCCARPATRCSIVRSERHRLAGAHQGPRRLCERRRAGDQGHDAGVRGLLAPGARSRRLRQRHEDEVRRQPAGRDPQRRERRGDGARHEGRARSGADLQADPGRRRQFARVRAARADDGRGPLRRRQPHHAGLDLAEGHEGDRRIRGKRRLPDAAVLGERADLSRGALDRARRSRTPAACARCWRRWRGSSDDASAAETRDGMRIDWDVPITMDDGLVLRADVFRPIAGRQVSGHPHLRSVRQGPRVPGRLSERVAAHGGEASRRRGGLVQPLSELGSRRPGEMGAGRLCVRARRFARRRPLARLSSIISRRARRRTSTTASNGPACSRGRTARSG